MGAKFQEFRKVDEEAKQVDMEGQRSLLRYPDA